MNLAEFQKQISESDKPVIVDFWASWCGPCMMTKPTLEKLGKEFNENVRFMPLNADDSREVLEKFRVYGIPTVVAFQRGKEAARIVGAQSEAGYRAMFESLAAGKEVKVPLTAFDRTLRLGAGGLFIAIGVSNGNWLLVGVGALLAFMGVYDRCPIWRALSGKFKRS
ncbi:MAG: hypothetical protein Fur002_05660 [Anaerolineales bacterium]